MSTPLPIDIQASLDCELNGQTLDIQVNQGVVVINVVSPESARALIGSVHRLGKIRVTVARLNSVLIAVSHRLEIHVDEVIVVSMGQGTNSGLLRLAGLPHVRIWPLRLLRRSASS